MQYKQQCSVRQIQLWRSRVACTTVIVMFILLVNWGPIWMMHTNYGKCRKEWFGLAPRNDLIIQRSILPVCILYFWMLNDTFIIFIFGVKAINNPKWYIVMFMSKIDVYRVIAKRIYSVLLIVRQTRICKNLT